MADVIIKARQNWISLDPDTTAGIFQAGDVVDIFPDNNNGKGYGRMVTWPKFLIVRVDATVEELKHMLEEAEDRPRAYSLDFRREIDEAILHAIKGRSRKDPPVVTKEQFKIRPGVIRRGN